jgi:hypothetical protein
MADEFQEIWGIGYERKVDRTLETALNGTSEKSIFSWLLLDKRDNRNKE